MKQIYLLGISALLSASYLVARFEFLVRAFGDYLGVYLWTGMIAALFGLYFALRSGSLLRRSIISLVSPAIGSLVGYSVLSLKFYFDRGHFVRVAFTDWLFTSSVSAFFMAEMWGVSLIFFMISLVGYAFGEQTTKVKFDG